MEATSSAATLGEGDVGSSSLALILALTFLVWVVTAVFLGLAAHRRRVTRHWHCPLLRRDVEVESDESNGRLLDMLQCYGLDPPTDFSLCGKRCLDLDELVVQPEEAAHSSR
jgi:hypothetical protein